MNDLTPERHAELIAKAIAKETIAKYMRGYVEHGTKLWELPITLVTDNAIEEAIDQGVYMKTVQQQLALLKEWLAELFRLLDDPVEEPLGDDEKALIAQIKELMGM